MGPVVTLDLSALALLIRDLLRQLNPSLASNSLNPHEKHVLHHSDHTFVRLGSNEDFRHSLPPSLTIH